MRALLLFALAACTSSHSMRVRTVDGLTGRPVGGERLTVKTFLVSSTCEHEVPTRPFAQSEGTSPDQEIDNTEVTSGRDGWATIQIIESRGKCDLRPTKIELYLRGHGREIDLQAKDPVFVPVFVSSPTHNSSERTYATSRAKEAFTPIQAVSSVYMERFMRVSDREPTVFTSADTFLVGAPPEIDADSDGDDPFLRIALARVIPSGTAWRIELNALAISPTTPEYVVPPGYETRHEQLEKWAKAMLDEVVLRAATAAKLIDRKVTREWTIKSRVEGTTITADILHDENPSDDEPAQQKFTVRGTIARRDGRVVVEGLARIAD